MSIVKAQDVAFCPSDYLLRWYRWALERKAADQWLLRRMATELVKRQLL